MNLLRKLVLLTASVIFLNFQSVAEINQLRISLNDGRTILIDLTEVTRTVGGETVTLCPVMKFAPDATSVQFELPAKSDQELPVIHTLEVEDLSNMNPIQAETSGIADVTLPETDITIRPLDGNTILISGATRISPDAVRVYDLRGQSVAASVGQDGDSLLLSLEALQAGVYLINVESVTVKIVKK